MNAHAHRTRAALATALALVGAGLVATVPAAADAPPLSTCAPLTMSRTDLGLGVSTGGGVVAGPIGQAVGDLDGDGDLDIAVVSETTYDVSVLKGDGHGTFAAPINLEGGQAPTGIAGGDFNGDGIVDTVTATHFPNQLEVRLGPVVDDSLGSSNLSTGDAFITAVTTGDFDDDGELDIAGLSGGTVYVFAGNGSGGFAAPVGHAAGGDGGFALATADFDEDGRTDLVVGDYHDTTASLLLQRAGGFADPAVLDLRAYPSNSINQVTAVTTGDFNGDGHSDFAATAESESPSGRMVVRLGDGTGAFTSARDVGLGSRPESLTTADLNHDGRLDLVAGLQGGASVTVALGKGTGLFTTQGFAVGSQPRAVAAGDFDGDLLPEVAVANYDSSTMSLLRNTSRSQNVAPVATDFAHSVTTGEPLEVDAPGVLAGASDSDCDLLAARVVEGPSHGTLTLRASGSFRYLPDAGYLGQDSFRYAVDDGFDPTTATVTLDVTTLRAAGDDATVTEGKGAQPLDVLGNDSNTDGSPFSITAVTQPTHGTVVVKPAGDGLVLTPQAGYVGPDTLTYTVADGDGHSATARVAVTVAPSRGCVSAAFGPLRSVVLDEADYLRWPTVADFDGDGDGDVAVPGSGTRMNLLRSDGAGGVTVTRVGDGGEGTSERPAIGDFDEDGLPDLMAPYPLLFRGGLWLGRATGSMLGGGGLVNFQLNGNWYTATGDVDEDGHLDALMTGGGGIRIARGDGHGGLTTGNEYITRISGQMVLRDVNGDGHLDIIGIGGYSAYDDVFVSLGDGTGAFAPEVRTRAGVTPMGFAVGDFDGDGTADVATVNIGANGLNEVALLRGDGTGHFTVVDSVQLGSDVLRDYPMTPVVSGDLNGDGRDDVLVPDVTRGRLLLLQSRGAGGLAPPRVLASPGPGTVAEMAVGDLDGNRSPDIVFVGQGVSDKVRVLDNLCPMPAPPVATDDGWTTVEDTALTIGGHGVLDNDTPADATASVATGPAHGSLSLASDGSFTYTPAANFNGADSFTYTITSAGGTDVGKVDLTVTPVNDRPTVTDDTAAVLKDSSANRVDVLANDSDVDGDAITVSVVTRPAHGTAAVVPGGAAVTYTPTRGYTGPDSFTYTVTDGHGGLATATVRLTVSAANRPPKPKADSAKVLMNSSGTSILVLANDSDPDKDPLKIVATSRPAHGTVAIPTGGTRVVYTPSPGYRGTDTFTYTVSDGRGGTATASVKVSVVRR